MKDMKNSIHVFKHIDSNFYVKDKKRKYTKSLAMVLSKGIAVICTFYLTLPEFSQA